MSSPLTILFEDSYCLAVVKPAGQFTQGTWAPPGEETLEQAVRRHLDAEHPDQAYVGIVHRLDRPVSGILLWAKSRKAARRLSKQFEARNVIKEYWAIVESRSGDEAGRPRGEEVWEDWLTAAGKDGKVRVVEPNSVSSRLARTIVKLEDASGLPPNVHRLQMWPATGRTHQLRVQTSTRGMPIWGDTLYGSAHDLGGGIALHARRLTIRHPIDQTELNLVAEPPPFWREFGIGVGEPANSRPGSASPPDAVRSITQS